jgi:hypothetical protein
MDCAGAAECEELRFPKRPPRRPWPELLPFVVGALLVPAAAPNGLFLVFLCACFSRSSSFFLNVLASFSSANDSAAKQSSSSKVWKKTRSWLYEKVSYISWSQMTPRLAACNCQSCPSWSPRVHLPRYPPASAKRCGRPDRLRAQQRPAAPCRSIGACWGRQCTVSQRRQRGSCSPTWGRCASPSACPRPRESTAWRRDSRTRAKNGEEYGACRRRAMACRAQWGFECRAPSRQHM